MPRKTNSKSYKSRAGDANSADDGLAACENAAKASLDVDEVSAAARFEQQFNLALDDASAKSAQTRTLALQSLCELLMHRFMPDVLERSKLTLLSCIEKSLRYGRGAEQLCGAKLAPLLSLQLSGDECIAKVLQQLLLNNVQNTAIESAARAKCCSALALLNFLSNDVQLAEDLLGLMKVFERIFSGSYLCGDDKPPLTTDAAAGMLQAAALSAWCLLLTILPPGELVAKMTSEQNMLPSMENMMRLLESTHLELRLVAGEALALILECGRQHDAEFLHFDVYDMARNIKLLATDSAKHRAKRDLKAQRATFRDVLKYVQENVSPEINVRFGCSELLVLDSWALQQQYAALCLATGPGMTNHLRDNNFVRNIFNLGAKILVSADLQEGNKQAKKQRHRQNAAAFKARTVERKENRDKRCVVWD